MLDLDRLKLPIKLDARWDNGMLHVRLSNKRGDTFFPYEIAYSHTEKLHLFIVDEAAHEYYHLHPAGDSMTGEWKAPFSPRSSGIFRIFAQCVHARTKRTLTTVTEIFANKDEDCDASLHNSHIQVSLINRPSADQIGSTIPLSFEINHPNLGPLEPLMGAYAHVALFQRENHQFGHLHPLASSETSKNKSMVNFLLNYNSTGPHILWLQFQLQGKCYFNRFEWQDT